MTAADVSLTGHFPHGLLLYDHDEELAARLADFVTDGLAAGEPVLLIVSARHWADLEGLLAARRAGDPEPFGPGTLIVYDAAETLGAISVDGAPDSDAFDRVVGRLIERIGTGNRPVKAFGEMVALFWEEGRLDEAIALETLWCRLGERHRFELLCAYPSGAFLPHDGVDALNEVCDLHSSVRPGGCAGAELVSFRAYPAVDQSVSRARRDLVALLTPQDSRETVEAAALVVTELATNAVRHARTAFAVELSRRAELIRIVVRDGDGRPLRPVGDSDDDESGRGLHLIAALSRQWGHGHTATGKYAWAEISTSEGHR